MRKKVVIVLSAVALGAAFAAHADERRANRLSADLSGYEETNPGTISTVATGRFEATINDAETEIDYELSYENLEGDVTQAHIHFGRRGTNGGISAWLCFVPNVTTPPNANTPACQGTRSGTVTGTIRAQDVVGPANQGIAPGEFAELIRAIRNRAAYVNVHSSKFGPGEIRNQIRNGHRHGHNHD